MKREDTGTKDDSEDYSDNPEFFKEITGRLVSYVQKNLNAAASCSFPSGKINATLKDDFDSSVKESMNYLSDKKLIDGYALESLYIDGDEKIAVNMVVKLARFSKHAVALKFSITDPKNQKEEDAKDATSE